MNAAAAPVLAQGLVRASLALVFSAVFLSGCGGGGGGSSPAPGPADTPSPTATPSPPATPSPAPSPTPAPPVANVAPIAIDGGTDGSAFNVPFVSVTVCQPGTSACATVDHVVLDTGSYGLRLVASALPAAVALPRVAAPGGSPLGECAHFASGFAWGSVRLADVAIVGERANAIPIQLVNDRSAGAPPASCSNTGPNLGVGGGANGILGVGFRVQDCGSGCAADPAPAVYYACGPSRCAPTAVPLALQVANPVAGFAGDNNGVAIVLPAIPLGGVPSIAGALTFGIGTQANNQPGPARVFTVDSQGNFTTTYKGAAFASFLDSGSNALFFTDRSLPKCPDDFYCPPAPLQLSAVVASPNGSSAAVDFFVESAGTLSENADTNAGHTAADDGVGEFDWGLPFFFGRTVWTAIEGSSTPLGPGPFWAF